MSPPQESRRKTHERERERVVQENGLVGVCVPGEEREIGRREAPGRAHPAGERSKRWTLRSTGASVFFFAASRSRGGTSVLNVPNI
ncbi:hypothetical protein NMG60_11023810 [Bertholletia excelsa]